jgi:hypothetical protein
MQDWQCTVGTGTSRVSIGGATFVDGSVEAAGRHARRRAGWRFSGNFAEGYDGEASDHWKSGHHRA